MKNWSTPLSITIALVCGWLLIQKNDEANAARVRASEAEAKQQAIAADVERQETKTKRLQIQLRQSRADAMQKSIEAQQLKEQLSSSNREANRPADALFRDPAMKEALKNEAREGVEKNVKALFKSGLAQELGLNDEQSAQLKALLMERTALLMEKIFVPMMTGELSEEEMAASGRATKQAYDENTARVRAFLGDEGFAAYESFEKSHEERENLSRFVPKFNDAGQPLTGEQQSQLLAMMTDERLNFKFQHDLGDMSQLDFEHWYDNFTDEKLVTFGQEMEVLNDRIVQRAETLLTTEQLALLKTFLNERLQQAKFVARSTTAMFGKKR